MKIIEFRRAPNPRRVRIFLAEKGVEIPFEQIDIMQQKHQDAEFSEQNPYRQVPVLVLDDGEIIAETVAICRYIEAINPEPRLFGASALEQARIEMWNRRAELDLFFRIAQAFRHSSPMMANLEVPQVREWGEANRAKVCGALGILDEALAKTAFLAGDKFSIADITAFVAVEFMRVIKMECPEEMTNLVRWRDRVAARPSATT